MAFTRHCSPSRFQELLPKIVIIPHSQLQRGQKASPGLHLKLRALTQEPHRHHLQLVEHPHYLQTPRLNDQ